MKAITTKYLGPTNYRGSRIKATAEGVKALTLPYPHEFGPGVEAHAPAAIALCRRMGWHGKLIGGGTDKGYVFVFSDPDHYNTYEIDSGPIEIRE